MSSGAPTRSVAIVGAGIAGAACAHALVCAGLAVHVFDKARGPGGRLSTRRLHWADAAGRAHTTTLDHGAVGFTARTASFQAFVGQALQAGWLAEWRPALAAGSVPLADGDGLYLPVPDLPSLCRRLLAGVAAATWSCHVDALHRGPHGWQVEAAGARLDGCFDAVVLALPPAQAAPLLMPHQRHWAQRATLALMQPCWTLMGIANDPALGPGAASDRPPSWNLARPPEGPLAWIIRNDARPGRAPVPGQAHWIVHARAGWSRHHLEHPPAWIQARMQAALAEWLGRPVEWQHAAVHRWRYAMPHLSGAAPAGQHWWDASQGLGACGDFLGGSGVEGAWLSGRGLAASLLGASTVALGPDAPAAPEAHLPTGTENPAARIAA